MTKKIATPCRPPSNPPITISNPVIRPSRIVVLKKLIAPLSRDRQKLSDETCALSVLFLKLRHKFRQSDGDFLDLDRIDGIPPQNVDSAAKWPPSRGVGWPEDRQTRRAYCGRQVRDAGIVADEGDSEPRDSRDRRQIEILEDRDATIAKDLLQRRFGRSKNDGNAGAL